MYGEILTADRLDSLMHRLCEKLQTLYADKLKSVILYGSYARGDCKEYSDVDVMALVDVRGEDKDVYWSNLTDINSDLGWEFDTMLSTLSVDVGRYERFKEDLPLYKNISEHGRVYYDNR